MPKCNAVVGQSGGPTAAINATLSGVVRGVKRNPSIGTLYGMFNGIEGFLEDRLCDLGALLQTEHDHEVLESTPAAALGSCRKKLPSVGTDDAVYEKIFGILAKHDIGYFFYIGGNDSMDTVAKLSVYAEQHHYDVKIVGVPKTIDNDLAGTDHAPGYGSAAKYIAASVSEMIRDCAVYTLDAVTIVEIMGRDAGWLTAAAALPRLYGLPAPDLVYLPEVVFDYEAFEAAVRAELKKKPNIVIAVSEGIKTADGEYAGSSSQSGAVDVFGHKYLAGTAKGLANFVKGRIGCKVRSVELNILQRCASHCASETDIRESVEIAAAAVDAAAAGATGQIIAYEREAGEEYRVRYVMRDIGAIANRNRDVARKYINEAGNNVTDELLRYIAPLVMGEHNGFFKNGLPEHFIIPRSCCLK